MKSRWLVCTECGRYSFVRGLGCMLCYASPQDQADAEAIALDHTRMGSD